MTVIRKSCLKKKSLQSGGGGSVILRSSSVSEGKKMENFAK